MKPYAQIIFHYYYDLDTPANFFKNVMGFEMVEDQGTTRIFHITGTNYIGCVNQATGFHKAQEKNAELVTILVDDMDAWYARMKELNVNIIREPELKGKDIHQHKRFVITDPGGYTYEIQQFLHPDTIAMYKEHAEEECK